MKRSKGCGARKRSRNSEKREMLKKSQSVVEEEKRHEHLH